MVGLLLLLGSKRLRRLPVSAWTTQTTAAQPERSWGRTRLRRGLLATTVPALAPGLASAAEQLWEAKLTTPTGAQEVAA